MKLKIVAAALTILISCTAAETTIFAAEKSMATTSKTKISRKFKKKAVKNSAFDPTDFIEKKQALESTQSKPKTEKKVETVTFGEGVVCNPVRKQRDLCTGPDCKQNEPITDQQQGAAGTESLINDNTKLTKAMINTIKENCSAVQDTQPFVKPVFEVGIKEPATGTSDKKEIVPKVGIQATF